MYKIKELANIASISTRTLRYYDKVGLLHPTKIDQNGYRYYDSDKVTTLQQILFYKELGYSLDKINLILRSSSFNQIDSLYNQLTLLTQKKDHIDAVINLVVQTIDTLERGETMSDKEKFEVWKQKHVKDNTDKYGEELQQKYDSSFIEQANQKYLKKSKYEIKQQEELTIQLNLMIVQAMDTNNFTSDEAMRMCDLHKDWICFYWPSYNKEKHLALVEMYTLDERFTKYYDKIRVGAAQFLYSAMKLYIQK